MYEGKIILQMSLNSNKNSLNDLRYMVIKKESRLKLMQEHVKDLEKLEVEPPRVNLNNNWQMKVTRLEGEVDNRDIVVQMEEMQSETLSHIIERDKLNLRSMMKPIDKLKRDIRTLESSTTSVSKVLRRNDEEYIIKKVN